MSNIRVEEAFDIYIVGLGIVSVHQITREVEAAMQRSQEVLYIANGFGLAEYLSQLCPHVTDLSAAYQEGEDRMNAYNIMTAKVVEAALDHHPVTFALYGHPLVFAWPPFQVLEVASLLGLRTKVLPGVSAMDCLFVDLKLDPAGGLQMYEATDLLLCQRPLQADIPCLVWQIGAVETRLYSQSTSKPERFSRIKNYLLKYYPPDHNATAVCCSSFPLVPSQLTTFALKDIEMYAQDLSSGVTLYIPPVQVRPIMDHELLKDIDSMLYQQKIMNLSAFHDGADGREPKADKEDPNILI
jgi:uncharacterized protein YabN with tetrapyrrole methylase and pyrophosphatase domain